MFCHGSCGCSCFRQRREPDGSDEKRTARDLWHGGLPDRFFIVRKGRGKTDPAVEIAAAPAAAKVRCGAGKDRIKHTADCMRKWGEKAGERPVL